MAAIRWGPNDTCPLTWVPGGYPCDPICPIWPGGPAEVRLQGDGANRASIADPAPSCRRDAQRGEFPVWGREGAAHTCHVVSSAGTGPRRGGGKSEAELSAAFVHRRRVKAGSTRIGAS